ncbi:CrcB family protein [Corynebacterium pseudodiphtheriticum]|uniref:CrcB family protein n=1 Tax=Corynebacterium pseudodiphtheriticum TaxID=37637 RepID=UPI00254B88C1|nr:CrcB family protein [Corynebacterium pseudodiphtheriticum]MDK8546233.1 CrcB family protein [Corynebacterium pseudodiphtheriticum]
MFREALMIGIGAAIGALVRFVTLAIFGEELFPVAVLDMIACFLMGYLAPGPFGAAGMLGGFSTYSAFVGLAFTELGSHQVFYVIGIVLACMFCWLGGDQLRNVLDLREKMAHFVLTHGPWAHPETNPRVNPDFRATADAADAADAAANVADNENGKDGEGE